MSGDTARFTGSYVRSGVGEAEGEWQWEEGCLPFLREVATWLPEGGWGGRDLQQVHCMHLLKANPEQGWWVGETCHTLESS